VTLLAFICGGSVAFAQSPSASGALSSQLEIWVSYGLAWSMAEGSLYSNYEPSLTYGQSTGSATQALTLAGDDATVAAIGVDYWPGKTFGIQLLAEWAQADVRGASSPYDVVLDYEARLPPDYELRPYHWERSYDWDDPTGKIDALTIALNAIGRWPLGDRFAATLSGGIATTRVEGDIDSLGFTTFQLGGHGVLFPEEYRIGTELESTWITGWDLGAAAEFALTRRIAIVLGYRYLGGADDEVPLHVREVLNADQVIISIPIEEIESRLSPGPVMIDVGGSRAWVGVKFALF